MCAKDTTVFIAFLVCKTDATPHKPLGVYTGVDNYFLENFAIDRETVNTMLLSGATCKGQA